MVLHCEKRDVTLWFIWNSFRFLVSKFSNLSNEAENASLYAMQGTSNNLRRIINPSAVSVISWFKAMFKSTSYTFCIVISQIKMIFNSIVHCTYHSIMSILLRQSSPQGSIPLALSSSDVEQSHTIRFASFWLLLLFLLRKVKTSIHVFTIEVMIHQENPTRVLDMQYYL